MKEQLVVRWDAFLAKIDARFNESLTYGEDAVLNSLEDNDYDYYGAFRTLKAIQSQVYNDLIQKISDTWQQQVAPLMRADGIYWAEESYKGHQLAESMHERMQLWLFVTEGKLSLKYYDHAIQLINRNFFCTQCNSPLQVKRDFFMAQYVTCNYCNAVNTFEPETKYAAIGWNVVNNIAALYSLNEYKEMIAAENKDAGIYKKAQRTYYEKYFDERIKLMPHTASTKEHDIELEIKKQSK
ncbi:hypothetical protein SNE25_12590 [Mucilaginibacter sabulilitoris]|uniref:Uncharacterized protein n=1 Tax=Mucilaginibacter sabulilitoris TaxID=1173583 RepID=A0ABZ0TU07_9SPHI|nr:hypothetical protein [Mucilaginibacter sabulilitoris]WPU96357.1 hypothetical protein SNE25_12590 [Mucilaginibacter sabulilitoris]